MNNREITACYAIFSAVLLALLIITAGALAFKFGHTVLVALLEVWRPVLGFAALCQGIKMVFIWSMAKGSEHLVNLKKQEQWDKWKEEGAEETLRVLNLDVEEKPEKY